MLFSGIATALIALHASPADRTRDVWVQFVVLHVLLFSRFSWV